MKSIMSYSVQVFLTAPNGWVTHSHLDEQFLNFTKTTKMCRDYIRKHISRGCEAYYEVYGWDTQGLKPDLEYKETVYCSGKTGKIYFRVNHTSRKKEYAHHLGLNARFIKSEDPRQTSLHFEYE